MNFFTYIVCWDDVYENVCNIEKIFLENNVPHKIINSGSIIHDHWMNVGDIRYTRQYYASVKDFDRKYEYVFWLTGDVGYHDWISFLQRVNYIITTYNVYTYAPYLTNENFGELKSKICELDNKLVIATYTDGIAVLLHRDLIDMQEKFLDYLSTKTDITKLISGWGLHIISSSYSIYKNKLVLRDNEHILSHPKGSSYNHSQAFFELRLTLKLFYEFCIENNINVKIIKKLVKKTMLRAFNKKSHRQEITEYYQTIPKILK